MPLKSKTCRVLTRPTRKTNITLTPRTLPNKLHTWLGRHLPKTDGRSAQALYTFANDGNSNEKRLRKVLADIGLPTRGANADAMISDLLKLAKAYRKMMNLPCVGLRFDVGSVGAGWHTDRDNREPRLLTTYYGAGTEWLRECDLEKRTVNTSAVWVKPDATSQVIPTGWLALLRGGREEGVVHRSPKIPPDSRRLLVIFEPATADHIVESRHTFRPTLRESLSNT